MPTLRKLTPAEIHTLEYAGTSQRKRIEVQYDEIVRSFAPGEYGEVEPEGDEKRLTVWNRLRAAAARTGVTLHFLRTPPPTLRFRVEAPGPAGVVGADGAAAHPQLVPPESDDAMAPRPVAPALEAAAPPTPARRSGRTKRRA